MLSGPDCAPLCDERVRSRLLVRGVRSVRERRRSRAFVPCVYVSQPVIGHRRVRDHATPGLIGDVTQDNFTRTYVRACLNCEAGVTFLAVSSSGLLTSVSHFIVVFL